MVVSVKDPVFALNLTIFLILSLFLVTRCTYFFIDSITLFLTAVDDSLELSDFLDFPEVESELLSILKLPFTLAFGVWTLLPSPLPIRLVLLTYCACCIFCRTMRAWFSCCVCFISLRGFLLIPDLLEENDVSREGCFEDFLLILAVDVLDLLIFVLDMLRVICLVELLFDFLSLLRLKLELTDSREDCLEPNPMTVLLFYLFSNALGVLSLNSWSLAFNFCANSVSTLGSSINSSICLSEILFLL
jgi:hypothetical protein